MKSIFYVLCLSVGISLPAYSMDQSEMETLIKNLAEDSSGEERVR